MTKRSGKKLELFTLIVLFISAIVLSGVIIGLKYYDDLYYFLTAKEEFVENDPTRLGYYKGETINPPGLISQVSIQSSNVLGDNNSTNKRIEVDLANQRVYTFEGDQKIHEFIVSTGLYGRTPTGEFIIERRVSSQTMKGGSKALGTYYYLPNVQYVQYFGNRSIPWWRGFSFHSTYWHSNFGHPMSHGCVNMKIEDALTLWNWTNATGTKVVIYGTAPQA